MTGELGNKIDGLWEIFWNGGITNPLDVIEQMTYLMFIKDLDDTDNLRAKEAAMLGLPFQSIFAENVDIGGRMRLMAHNSSGLHFMIFLPRKCIPLFRNWCFPLSKIFMAIRTPLIANIWMMPFLRSIRH